MKFKTLAFFCLMASMILILSACSNKEETTKAYNTLMEHVQPMNLPAQEDKNLAFRFQEGLSSYKKGGLWGFIDKQGKIVIEPQYESAVFFSDGVAIVKKNGLYGYIDKSGNEVIPMQYQDATNFVGGIASVYDGEKWFLIDRNGSPLSDFDYSLTGQDAAINLRDGYAIYQEGELSGYVDQKGKLAIPAQFESLGHMSSGYAFVTKGWVPMIIDKSGNNAFPEFSIREQGRGFEDGLALITLEDGSQVGKSIVINNQGDIVFEVPKEFSEYPNLTEGLISFYDVKTQKYGCLDLKGNVVIPAVLDLIGSSNDGVVEVYIGSKIPFYIKNPVWQDVTGKG